MSKFKLTSKTITTFEGHTLYQIRAPKDFSNVKTGDLGGYIEKEGNLSQIGNAWVFDDAKVYEDAWISGNALICDFTKISGKEMKTKP